MKISLTLIFLIVFSSITLGQHHSHRCGTTQYIQQLEEADPAAKANLQLAESLSQTWTNKNPNNTSKQVITIPVVFHVLYNNVIHNINDQRLLDQLQVLNEDYRKMNADTSMIPAAFKGLAADCEIQFCLAQRDPQGNATTGITRTQTSHASFSISDDNLIKFSINGGMDIWDRNSYLNIWVCNLTGGLLGYATLPGSNLSKDGVVLAYRYVGVLGSAAPYNKGRTATHEVGHWLGLYHIWGDDGGSCMGSDLVADTPNQADYNEGCPSFPHTDTCQQNYPGVMYMNYMDYVNDACMQMFTYGQKNRMWGFLNTSRNSLFSSNGCNPVGIEESVNDNVKAWIWEQSLNISECDPISKMKVDLFDLSGKLLYSKEIIGSNSYQLLIDSELAKGVYLLKIRGENINRVKKLMVQ